MHMGHYQGEKSIGLLPIVLALSAVAIAAFSLLYFTVGHQGQTNVSIDGNQPQLSPAMVPVLAHPKV